MWFSPFVKWTTLLGFTLQHSESILHYCGFMTNRHLRDLNHSINRLDRRIDELSDLIDQNEHED